MDSITFTNYNNPLTVLCRTEKKTDYQKFFNLLKFLGQMQSCNTMTAEAVDKDLPEQSSPLQDWNTGGIRVQQISPHPPMAAVNSLRCVLSENMMDDESLSQGLSRPFMKEI